LQDFFEVDLVGLCFQGLSCPEGELEVVEVFQLIFVKQLHLGTFWTHDFFFANEPSDAVRPCMDSFDPINLLHKQAQASIRSCIDTICVF
jgi:hypothetical protein